MEKKFGLNVEFVNSTFADIYFDDLEDAKRFAKAELESNKNIISSITIYKYDENLEDYDIRKPVARFYAD